MNLSIGSNITQRQNSLSMTIFYVLPVTGQYLFPLCEIWVIFWHNWQFYSSWTFVSAIWAALNQFRSYLTNCYQSVLVTDLKSSPFVLEIGVPQGSLPDVVSRNIVNYHYHIHVCIWHPVYKSVKFYPVVVMYGSVSEWCKKMEDCQLKMKGDKAEVLFYVSKGIINDIQSTFLTVKMKWFLSVYKLKTGIYLDPNSIVKTHIRLFSKIVYLLRIEQLFKYLKPIKTLISSFIFSRLSQFFVL